MSRSRKKRVRFKRQKKFKIRRHRRRNMRHRRHRSHSASPKSTDEKFPCTKHKHCSKHRPRFNLKHCCCFQCPPGNKMTSTDKLILRYLKNLHTLTSKHNEEQWKTALTPPKGAVANSVDHFKKVNSMKHLEERVNRNVYKPSHPEAGKYFAEVKKIPHAEKKSKKERAVQQIIAHTLKYGVQKGILKKDGYVFKVCRPYRSCIDFANRAKQHKSRTQPAKKYKSENVVLHPEKKEHSSRNKRHTQKPYYAKRKKYYVRSAPSLTNSLKSSVSSSNKSLSEYKPLNYQRKYSPRHQSSDKSGRKSENWTDTNEAHKWRRILKRHRLKYIKKKKRAKEFQDKYRKEYNDRYNSKRPQKQYSIQTLYKSRSRTPKSKPHNLKVKLGAKQNKSDVEVTNSFDDKWDNANYPRSRERSMETEKIHKVEKVNLKYLDPHYKKHKEPMRVLLKRYKHVRKSTPISCITVARNVTPVRKVTPIRKVKYCEPSDCSVPETRCHKPDCQISKRRLRFQQNYSDDDKKLPPVRKRKHQSPSISTDSGKTNRSTPKKSPARERTRSRSVSKRTRRNSKRSSKFKRHRAGSDSRSRTPEAFTDSDHFARSRAGSSSASSTYRKPTRRSKIYREKSVGTTFSNRTVKRRKRSKSRNGFSIIEYIKNKYLKNLLSPLNVKNRRKRRYWRSRSSTRSRNRYNNMRSSSVTIESVQVKKKIKPRSKSTGYINKYLSCLTPIRKSLGKNFRHNSKFSAFSYRSKSQRSASVASIMSLIRNIKQNKDYSFADFRRRQKKRLKKRKKRRRARSYSVRKRKRSRYSTDGGSRKRRKMHACSDCKLKFKKQNKKHYNK